MPTEVERRLTEAFHADAQRARLANPDRPPAAGELYAPAAPHRSHTAQWLAAAAVVVLVAVLGAIVWRDGGTDDGTVVDVSIPPTTSTKAPDGLATALATGEDVAISGGGYVGGHTLNIDAKVEDGDVTGEVTGEFRVDNVVVTVQCADTEFDEQDLILGGEVTDDPDGRGLGTGGHNVAVGDQLALIIREGQSRPGSYNPALYVNSSAGSCTDLVESVRYNLDGGYFTRGQEGIDIKSG